MSQNREEEEERRRRQANTNHRSNDVVTDGAAGGQVNLADFNLAIPSPTPSPNPKMRTPAERLETFKSYTGGNKDALARAGFHLMANNTVKCDGCGITVPLTSDLSDPLDLHFNMAPTCPLLRALVTSGEANTRTNTRTSSSAILPETPAVFSQPPVASSPYEVRKGLAEPRTSQYPVKYPEYDTVDKRFKSFTGWPFAVVKQEPRIMSVCGFFYIGSADRVRCFSCGTTLRNWEPGDDPFKEHQTWAPRCEFIKLLRPETVPRPSPAPEDNAKSAPAPAPAPTPAPEPAKVPPTPTLRTESVVAAPAAGTNPSINRYLSGGSFGNTSVGSVPAPRVPASTSMPVPSNTAGNARAQEVPTTTPSQPGVQQISVLREEDPMASPQVKAVLEMGVAETVIREILSARRAQGLGQFDSAVDLFLATEQFASVK